MSLASIGDLSRAMSLRSANSRTKDIVTTLSRELATGRRSDLPKSAGGDTSRLAGIEHRLHVLGTLRRNCDEARGRLDAVQDAMAAMQAIASRSGTGFLAASATATIDQVLVSAQGNLDAAVGLLNTQVSGEFVFAGARVTTRPVIDSESLLSQVTAAIGGLTGADDIIAAVDAFFEAPTGGGGFVDLAYRGAAEGPGPVSLSPVRSIDSDLTAASEPFRALLKGLTLASLASGTSPAAGDPDRLAMVRAAGQSLLEAEGGIVRARSEHGVLQETVELARTRNIAESSSLEIARTEVVSSDPYETAAALSEAQLRLETLYAITARLSELSLARRL